MPVYFGNFGAGVHLGCTIYFMPEFMCDTPHGFECQRHISAPTLPAKSRAYYHNSCFPFACLALLCLHVFRGRGGLSLLRPLVTQAMTIIVSHRQWEAIAKQLCVFHESATPKTANSRDTFIFHGHWLSSFQTAGYNMAFFTKRPRPGLWLARSEKQLARPWHCWSSSPQQEIHLASSN